MIVFFLNYRSLKSSPLYEFGKICYGAYLSLFSLTAMFFAKIWCLLFQHTQTDTNKNGSLIHYASIHIVLELMDYDVYAGRMFAGLAHPWLPPPQITPTPPWLPLSENNASEVTAVLERGFHAFYVCDFVTWFHFRCKDFIDKETLFY